MPKITPYQLLLYQAVQIQAVGRSETFNGIVAKVPRRQVVVRLPDDGPMPARLSPGADIVVRSEDGSGLRVGKSKIVDVLPGPRPGIVIKPPRFNTIQNRQFFRMLVNFPCSLQQFGPNG